MDLDIKLSEYFLLLQKETIIVYYILCVITMADNPGLGIASGLLALALSFIIIPIHLFIKKNYKCDKLSHSFLIKKLLSLSYTILYLSFNNLFVFLINRKTFYTAIIELVIKSIILIPYYLLYRIVSSFLNKRGRRFLGEVTDYNNSAFLQKLMKSIFDRKSYFCKWLDVVILVYIDNTYALLLKCNSMRLHRGRLNKLWLKKKINKLLISLLRKIGAALGSLILTKGLRSICNFIIRLFIVFLKVLSWLLFLILLLIWLLL